MNDRELEIVINECIQSKFFRQMVDIRACEDWNLRALINGELMASKIPIDLLLSFVTPLKYQ